MDKKIFVFLLVAIVALSLSAVSAADTTDDVNMVASYDDAVVGEVNNDISIDRYGDITNSILSINGNLYLQGSILNIDKKEINISQNIYLCQTIYQYLHNSFQLYF
mgnify:CR=1 FL=1